MVPDWCKLDVLLSECKYPRDPFHIIKAGRMCYYRKASVPGCYHKRKYRAPVGTLVSRREREDGREWQPSLSLRFPIPVFKQSLHVPCSPWIPYNHRYPTRLELRNLTPCNQHTTHPPSEHSVHAHQQPLSQPLPPLPPSGGLYSTSNGL